MKILFMGSSVFAVPSLVALLESSHDVVGIVTQPDKPAGRGYELTPCPVAVLIQEKGRQPLKPKTLRSKKVEEHFKSLHADLFVVVAYGKILPKEILAIPPKGCINVHASLLPKYRGAAPIHWAIANGETETGVTTMYLSEEMDAGDIIYSSRTEIDACEKASDLHDRLAIFGAELLQKTVEAIEKGAAPRKPQHHSEATSAPILNKEDGKIDWTLSAEEIYNRVRAFTPWPGAFTFWGGKRLQLHEVAVVESQLEMEPGTVLHVGNELAVATGAGDLYLLEVQLEGKKRMSTIEFLRGHEIKSGTKLG
ncbi:MAG: methionyl-tRNA formyltransferase [Deltaproteobacteria bacterium RIFCSPLOWO2_02_FULL_44_10]|nr:MAG: methionyl-tRNA formyltransferase [Deltaproteobacteria bacterium RIFCSPHIGHO2_02_FULL_44_16]OGQ47719.1 MAG: methionyl-tRNA formyltransferase [Deltaproteobacteria bacterium RIFCSPLOWO2_02_FULL_44_10]